MEVALAVVSASYRALPSRQVSLIRSMATLAYEAGTGKRETMKQFTIHSLPEAERDRLSGEWLHVQQRFAEDPRVALCDADRLVQEVMDGRGYPMNDFEGQAEELSVLYPTVVLTYRTAHEIVLRQDQGQATAKELRKAMVHYRSLFDELLEIKRLDRREAA
jgi:hypothetical protein